MRGCQNFGTNLELTSKRKWLGNPVVEFFGDLGQHSIPKFQRRRLEGKRDAKKSKDFTMGNPFPLKLAESGQSWRIRLAITKCLMPLDGRARSLTKGVQTR